jgi:hypothetical protein
VWKRQTKTVQNLAALRRENDYVPYRPYLRHASDEVIIMPGGCGMRMFELQGRSFETNDWDELVAWHNKLNIAIRQIGDDRFSMWTHIVRRPIEPYRADGFRSDFARALDQKYYDKLVGTTFYENRFYVTIIVKPVDGLGQVRQIGAGSFGQLMRHVTNFERASNQPCEAGGVEIDVGQRGEPGMGGEGVHLGIVCAHTGSAIGIGGHALHHAEQHVLLVGDGLIRSARSFDSRQLAQCERM